MKRYNQPNEPKKSKSKTPPTKHNIILDLDHTILHTIHLEHPFEGDVDPMMFPVMGNVIHIADSDACASGYYRPGMLTFLRPHFNIFWKECAKHFNISIWTSGSGEYCLNILNTLEILNDCQHVFYRVDNTKKFRPKDKNAINMSFRFSHGETIKYKEHFTKTIIPITFNFRTVSKSLETLWQHNKFGKIYNPDNTFLIDDLVDTYINTQSNIIFIDPWCYLNWQDKVLLYIINEIKKYDFQKDVNIQKICLDINKLLRKKVDKKWQKIGSACANSATHYTSITGDKGKKKSATTKKAPRTVKKKTKKNNKKQ